MQRFGITENRTIICHLLIVTIAQKQTFKSLRLKDMENYLVNTKLG